MKIILGLSKYLHFKYSLHFTQFILLDLVFLNKEILKVIDYQTLGF